MMEPLPFELDRPELLEAAALALTAVAVPPAQAQRERTRSYAVWQRESAGDPRRMPERPPEAEGVDSWLDLAAISTGLSAEDLSREIDRDARRFEAI